MIILNARTVFPMRSVNVDAYKDWWIIAACRWGWRKDVEKMGHGPRLIGHWPGHRRQAVCSSRLMRVWGHWPRGLVSGCTCVKTWGLVRALIGKIYGQHQDSHWRRGQASFSVTCRLLISIYNLSIGDVVWENLNGLFYSKNCLKIFWPFSCFVISSRFLLVIKLSQER